MLDMVSTDLGDGLQRPVVLLGDVDSLHLLVNPGPLPGVTLKRLLLLLLLLYSWWLKLSATKDTLLENDFVLGI